MYSNILQVVDARKCQEMEGNEHPDVPAQWQPVEFPSIPGNRFKKRLELLDFFFGKQKYKKDVENYSATLRPPELMFGFSGCQPRMFNHSIPHLYPESPKNLLCIELFSVPS